MLTVCTMRVCILDGFAWDYQTRDRMRLTAEESVWTRSAGRLKEIFYADYSGFYHKKVCGFLLQIKSALRAADSVVYKYTSANTFIIMNDYALNIFL